MRTTLRSRHDGSKLPEMAGAVIYVRVSTKEQTENLSLPTQLKACEGYCQRQGFHVIARFREEGESAKTADRTELQRLLQYSRTNKSQVQFVVVFNLTRFAREVRPFRGHRKWRLANAQPEPDFKYRSNLSARSSSKNFMITMNFHGRPDAVCGHWPALCAARRAATFDVKPV